MQTGANGIWAVEPLLHESIAMEHYRLHTVEQWPDGPYKAATLDAIHASLTRLTRDAAATYAPACSICSNRRNAPTVIKFPTQSKPRRAEGCDFERMAS